MGGLSTAVTDRTADVFFEAAFWPPAYMAGKARAHGMHTDASLRFERGVDPEGQGRAVERATQLLLDIAGGDAGPLVVTTADEHRPVRPTISLRRARLAQVLGDTIDDDIVTDILNRLELSASVVDGGWQVTAPSHRFDIAIEADLIEELARIYGYDRIPDTNAIAATVLETVTETSVNPNRVATMLTARDYQEVVTYSFVGAEEDRLISGRTSEIVLSNPISSEMSVMRSSLWPGLLSVAASNEARQQNRVRLFEIGRTFHGSLDAHSEVDRIGGLISGSALSEQWGAGQQNADFFDIKADIEAVLRLAADDSEISFAAIEHAALQPGQAASILRNGDAVGVIGKLHPTLAKQFALKRDVYLFELDSQKTLASQPPIAQEVSRFPAIRRDIAVLVDENISADQLVQAVASTSPGLAKGVRIFDIYRGPGVEAGLKASQLA